jgi:hypothetical protein
MQTPEVILSPSERRMLTAIARGDEQFAPFDWLALQRLKAFGFVEETPEGRPKITAEGRRVVGRAQ